MPEVVISPVITERDLPRPNESAKDADAVVLCLGLSPKIEGEEGDAFNSDASGDKLSLKLPGVQEELLERLQPQAQP